MRDGRVMGDGQSAFASKIMGLVVDAAHGPIEREGAEGVPQAAHDGEVFEIAVIAAGAGTGDADPLALGAGDTCGLDKKVRGKGLRERVTVKVEVESGIGVAKPRDVGKVSWVGRVETEIGVGTRLGSAVEEDAEAQNHQVRDFGEGDTGKTVGNGLFVCHSGENSRGREACQAKSLHSTAE